MTNNLIERADQVIAATYKRFPIVLTRARGARCSMKRVTPIRILWLELQSAI